LKATVELLISTAESKLQAKLSIPPPAPDWAVL
jgi:hypothetical protein